MSDVTLILSAIEQGDPSAAEQLLPLVYRELRRLAAAKLANEKSGQTLQATALVHEAYIRLLDTEKAEHWNSRGHFFGAAAEAMRRILVDQARRKNSLKQGAKFRRQELTLDQACESGAPEEVLAVDEALDKLARENPTVARLVELRYFAGLSPEESAAALGVTPRTGRRYWVYAKAWLLEELSDGEER